MQIKYLGAEKFELKTKEAKVIFSREGIEIDGFKIAGPGEYERKEIFVQGISLDGDAEAVYLIQNEGMTLCYVGILKTPLTPEAVKAIGDIDILFVPLGAEGTLELKEAQKLISDIDPRVVIPMLYSNIQPFKNAEGITDSEIDWLKIRKTDLPEEERKFYILKANS